MRIRNIILIGLLIVGLVVGSFFLFPKFSQTLSNKSSVTPTFMGREYSITTPNIFHVRPTGKYKVESKTGNESHYNVVFTPTVSEVEACEGEGKDENCWNETVTNYTICMEAGFEGVQFETKGKNVTYNIPPKISYYKTEELSKQTDLDRSLEKGIGISPSFEVGDKYTFCTESMNPKIDKYIKLGDNSIVIVPEDEAYSDAILTDVVVEVKDNNHSHLNISGTSPYDNLVAYYSFDGDIEDTTGKTIHDWGSSNTDLSGTGDALVNSSCLFGECGQFDGGADYYSATNPGLAFTNGTIMAWAKTSSATAIESIFSIGYGTGENEYFSLLFASGKPRIDFDDGADGCGSKSEQAFSSYNDGDWHLITGVVHSQKNITIYVDGIEASSPTSLAGCEAEVNPTADWVVGSLSTSLYRFNGSIDEIMFFDTIVSVPDILAIYQNTSARFKQTGTQEQKSINISEGSNRINVSATFDNLFSTNLSARVGYWNVSKGYNDTKLDDGVSGFNLGLQGYFHLDSNTGWNDSSGWGRNGTPEQDVFLTSLGYYSGSAQFDGTNDAIQIDDVAKNISGSSEATVSIWVLNHDSSATSWIEALGEGSDFEVGWTSGQKYGFLLDLTPGSSWTIESDIQYTDAGNWHHIVGRYNGTTQNLWIDGIKQVDQHHQIGTIDINLDSFDIGGTTDEWDGLIDELILWNRSLSDQEIKELYVKGRASWEYSEPQNLTTNVNSSFVIDVNSSRILPEFQFQSDSNQFYTPVLTNFIVYEDWFAPDVSDNPPVSILSFPADNANYSNSTIITFEVNGTDDNGLRNVTLWVWNEDTTLNHTNYSEWNGTTNSTTFTYNFTGDGLYEWNALVYDSASQSDWDVNRTLNISDALTEPTDTTLPSMEITYPTNISYGENVSTLNYTYIETNPDSCLWSLDGGTVNSSSVVMGTNFTNVLSAEGDNNLTLYCNDTSNNWNQTSVSYYQDSIAPAVTNFASYGLNSSQDMIGNGEIFNSANLTVIEYARINFTLSDTNKISGDINLFFTANGTNSCSLGNNQSSTCFNETSGWINFRNGTLTTNFKDEGAQGDFINCNYTTSGADNERNYSCLIDEHYNPNVFKWYDADYNFSDVKWQDGVNQQIVKNRMLKIELNTTIIPLDADQYKLDFRANYTASGTEPLEAYGCNSSYSTGDPEDLMSCALIGTLNRTSFQDDGTKFRTIFTKQLIDELGDLKYIILENHESNPSLYYYIKSYAVKTPAYTTHWEYSITSGGSWANLGDGYETELNINWFYDGASPTEILYKIQSNDTFGNIINSSTFNQTWNIDPAQNYPPIVSILTPLIDSNNSGLIMINWTTVEPNDDNWTTNVTAQQGVTTISVATQLPNQFSNTTWDSTAQADGKWNITMISCENDTADLFCSSDRHLINVDNTFPDISIVTPTNNTNTTNPLIDVNYTVSDTNLDSCWYSNDSMEANTTLAGCGNITTVTWVEGLHNVTIYANDSSNNLNQSTVTFRVDTQPPYFNETPINQSYLDNETVDYQMNATDLGVGLDCFAVNETATWNITCAGRLNNITALTVKNYTINITINDSQNNLNSTILGINVTTSAITDLIIPSVTVNFPINQTNYSQTTMLFNVTATDETQLDSCLYSLNGGEDNNTMTNASTSPDDYNHTNSTIGEGRYLANFYCNDTNNNWNLTENTNFTIDTTPPYFDETPTNQSQLDNVSTRYDMNATDTWIDIDCFAVNESSIFNITCGGLLVNTTTLIVKNYTLNITINDTLNHLNSTIIGINVTNSTTPDTINPDVTVNFPINQTNYSQTTMLFNVTATDDTQVSGCSYSLNNGVDNFTMTNASTSPDDYNATNSTIGEGRYLANFYCNDTTNNLNSTENVNFTIDLTPPYFDEGPTNQSHLDNESTRYDMNATDTFTDLDCFAVNESSIFNITCGGLLVNTTALTVKNYTLNITINDSANNLNSTIIGINVTTAIIPDTTPPYFDELPVNQSQTHLQSTRYDMNASDETSFDCFAVNESSIFNITCGGLLVNTTTLIVKNYTINITINDSSNNLNSTILGINVTNGTTPDVVNPSVTVNFPINQTNYSQTTMLFNVTSTDDTQMSGCWYTLNEGVDNITMTNVSTSVDDYTHTNTTIGEGHYLANFYCNDTTNNVNNTENTNFTIDLTPPYFDELPTNQSQLDNESTRYDMNATDTFTSLSCFAVNDTSNFNITCEGLLVNTTALTVKNYTLNITINDSANNLNSTIIGINVTSFVIPDITPPYFDELPTNQSQTDLQSTSYDMNASDETEFDCFAVNESSIFSVTCGGLLTNITALTVKNYTINITINDSSNNLNSTILGINVINGTAPDTTPPTITNPRNLTQEANTTFSQDMSATDINGISGYALNDTNIFNITQSGIIMNATSLTNVTLYNLNYSVNDSVGNTKSMLFWINITETQPMLLGNLTISGLNKILRRVVRLI